MGAPVLGCDGSYGDSEMTPRPSPAWEEYKRRDAVLTRRALYWPVLAGIAFYLLAAIVVGA